MIKHIYICDKCGLTQEITIHPRSNEPIYGAGWTYDGDKDLCSYCQTKLIEYMNKKKDEWFNKEK